MFIKKQSPQDISQKKDEAWNGTHVLCFRTWVGLSLLVTAAGCGNEPQARVYTEETHVQKAVSPICPLPGQEGTSELLPAAGTASSEVEMYKWVLPDGWEQVSGEGFRMATFYPSDGSVEAALSSLPGGAGGIEANIRRWAGQLGAGALTEDEIEKLSRAAETFETDGGLPAKIIDFSSVEPADQDQIVFLVHIIETDRETLFLKMSGPRDDLNRHREGLRQLTQSLEPAS